MSERRADTGPGGNAVYRISELVDVAGVSRDMIKYYLRAGLLPPARKPRPNLSHYTDDHLKLIGLIRRFQEQTRLSLQEIAVVFEEAAFDPSALEIELLSARHGAEDHSTIIPLDAARKTPADISLPHEFLDTLEGVSLLEPEDSENSDQVAGLLWAAHEAGVPLSFFEAAKTKLAELADLEVKTLIGIRRPDLNFDRTVDHVRDVDHIINRWMVAEKSRQIRSQFQRVLDNSERAISSLLDTIYRPSELFLERHQAEATLARLLKAPQDDPSVLARALDLCLAALSLGAYEETIGLARAALDAGANPDIATAFIAIAHGIQGDVDTAYDFARQLEDCRNTHPVILQARIASILLKASRLGGVADTNEMMKMAGDLFLQLPAQPEASHPEAVLLLARANAAFPDFANSRDAAIDALERLQRQLDNDSADIAGLGIPGLEQSLEQVYRIYVAHYLGTLHDMAGDREAARAHFTQVVQIDPASNFGVAAYRRLGELDDGRQGEAQDDH